MNAKGVEAATLRQINDRAGWAGYEIWL